MENTEFVEPILEATPEELELFKDIEPKVVELAKNLFRDCPDPAHDWTHVLDVARASHLMHETFGTPLTPLLLASLFHDMYSHRDRKNHHLLASKAVVPLLKPTKHAEWSYDVSLCCLQHRASFTGQYHSEIQEAFAAADRGVLHSDSINDVVKRSYDFTLSKGYSHKEAIHRVSEHMHDKFSHTGYAKWPLMYQIVFEKELDTLKTAASNMTPEWVKSIIYQSK